MMTRAIWAVVSAATGLLLWSFFLQPLGAAATSVLLALAILAAVRPFESFLLLAAFAPLSTMLLAVLDVTAGSLRLIEGLTLAFLTGWAARRVRDPTTITSSAFLWNTSALVTAALASAIVVATGIFREEAGSAPWHAVDDWFRTYAVHLEPTAMGLLFAQGPLLALAVASVCGGDSDRRNAATRMMAIGAAGAALFNVSRLLIDGALFREEPLRRFVDLLLSVRVNVHHSDLNAAGSYFALAWFLALGIAIRERVIGIVCVLLITAGLWTTGSRVAMIATLAIAVLSLLVAAWPHARKRIVVILLLVVIGALGVALWRHPLQRHVADPSLATRIRMGLASGAIAMAADHPVFGVGVGRFYEQSATYVQVPNYIVRENAHNNFLQVLAELGLPGFWLFLGVIGLSLSATRAGDGAAMWPLAAAITAYLLTCLGGHPLLVPHAAVPFWMALGLAAGSGVPTPHPLLRVIAGILIAFFVLTLPIRIGGAMRSADLEGTSFGLSAWQRLETGERFRWAAGHATFYVHASARAVTVPLRAGADVPAELEVRVLLDGRDADRIILRPDQGWRSIRLILPRGSDAAFARIDLETRVPNAARVLDPQNEPHILMVGRPLLHP